MSSATQSDTVSPPPPQQPKRHVALFPFMSKGHTIPLLHLARLLLRRGLAVTFFTTSANRPFIQTSLADTAAAVISLPFPANVPGLPAGVESTENLPSLSLFPSFAAATELMQPHFEQALLSLRPRLSFMVSDGFLWWTQGSADKLAVPRFAFYGMSNYAASVGRDVTLTKALSASNGDDNALVTVPSFPWIRVTAKDFDPVFRDPSQSDPAHVEFIKKAVSATARSSGMIVNSFREIEAVFADYWDRKLGPKSYYVGPLCINEPKRTDNGTSQWLRAWLGSRSSVLYVAFGSQMEISREQIGEIAKGLEDSEVSFLWALRKREQIDGLPEGFEKRVRERGFVAREWVDQREILMHESVKGFLSHCGWNSVMESVCAEVPILALPVAAEQPLNARMVAEEIRVGLRVSVDDHGLVKWEELKKMVKELMEGERGKRVRERVKEVAAAARRAVGEAGSSWRALDSLVDVACKPVVGNSGEVACIDGPCGGVGVVKPASSLI